MAGAADCEAGQDLIRGDAHGWKPKGKHGHRRAMSATVPLVMPSPESPTTAADYRLCPLPYRSIFAHSRRCDQESTQSHLRPRPQEVAPRNAMEVHGILSAMAVVKDGEWRSRLMPAHPRS